MYPNVQSRSLHHHRAGNIIVGGDRGAFQAHSRHSKVPCQQWHTQTEKSWLYKAMATHPWSYQQNAKSRHKASQGPIIIFWCLEYRTYSRFKLQRARHCEQIFRALGQRMYNFGSSFKKKLKPDSCHLT